MVRTVAERRPEHPAGGRRKCTQMTVHALVYGFEKEVVESPGMSGYSVTVSPAARIAAKSSVALRSVVGFMADVVKHGGGPVSSGGKVRRAPTVNGFPVHGQPEGRHPK